MNLYHPRLQVPPMEAPAMALPTPRHGRCAWEWLGARAISAPPYRSCAAEPGVRLRHAPAPARGEAVRARPAILPIPWVAPRYTAAAAPPLPPLAATAPAATPLLPPNVLFSGHPRIQSGCLQTWAEPPPSAHVDTAVATPAPRKVEQISNISSELSPLFRCPNSGGRRQA